MMSETMSDGSVYAYCQEATVTCDVGQFLDEQLNECQPCADGCMDCLATSMCLECNTDLVLQWTDDMTEAWCVQPVTCLENEYLGPDNTCYPCSYGCQQCTGNEGSCEICEQGFELMSETMTDGSVIAYCQETIVTCDVGQYLDEQFNECMPCADGCMNCSAQHMCFECNAGLVL